MSQHISGEVGQTVRQDYGEFIVIAGIRCRKELVTTYGVTTITDAPDKPWGIRVSCGTTFGIPIGTIEEAQQEVEKVDWLFKKDSRDDRP